MADRESLIEKQSCLIAKKYGWFQAKIEKASIRGFPDRIFVRNGKTVYVEFKTSTGVLSEAQKYVIEQLKAHGAEVWIISSKEQADVVFR